MAEPATLPQAVPPALPPALSKASWARWLIVVLPYLWLGLFFLAPFFIIVKIALSDTASAMPPYTPVFQGFSQLGDFLSQLDFESFQILGEDPLYIESYLSSLRIAAISTLLLLLIGYPMALAMARAKAELRPTLVMMVILPFWTSFLIRVYAWIGILKPEGLLTLLLQSLHIYGPDQQVHIYQTDIAVFIGIVYSYLPFMVLPLYSALEKMDGSLLEAASDLGCPPITAFWRITFPLSLPGVIAGSMICFIPITGEFVIPDLLGGADTLMIGKTMWTEFFGNRDWPVASAVAIVLLLLLVVPIVIFQNQQSKV
ncbi:MULTISPECIES: ABC transporter permease subunit [Rhizobium/Agrobacterium group]|uniref:ABC transporter permease subunit n=1 Tax=Rhizobium/Agrobacterium group TaxID=227290 RepID=UPI0008DC26AE|nr:MULTISPECIES: ABC transporter permease subunit [Rhizobium/Agrobacterium group]MCF1434850.1 ABC transporter permease subunit [Allorhizobium ampelinum]MCF1484622.1 ABC transporter permease subunit [Allorhizobium ampelinum]MUO92090.1 ABC transporter permease subunit [Agrobacterium vitis]MUZ53598.1 ABC transporter permease subunit [Agrobacterium vitis]MUZ93313.1 ABC transporter permease subunit [Agrobacterium vitis]